MNTLISTLSLLFLGYLSLVSSTPTPSAAPDPYAKSYTCDPYLRGRGEGMCPPEPNDALAFKCVSVRSCIAVFPIPDSCRRNGICVLAGEGENELQQCGGFAGEGPKPRPDVKCVDDPRDDCVPTEFGGNGSDCGGVWALKKAKKNGN